MFKNLLALAGMSVLLVSCCTNQKGCDTSAVATPGSAEDFNKNVANTVYFGFDKYNLTPEAKDTLGQVSSWLKMYTQRNITVEGHTDRRGTVEYNLALGNRRAESVKSFLVESGVDSSRVSTISYGKESPVSEGKNEQDHAMDRRAQAIVVE